MTESEILELSKKVDAGIERDWSSQARIWVTKDQLISYTNAAIKQATQLLANTNPNTTEIQRLKIEIEVLDVAYGESIGDMIKERRARLAELTKG